MTRRGPLSEEQKKQRRARMESNRLRKEVNEYLKQMAMDPSHPPFNYDEEYERLFDLASAEVESFKALEDNYKAVAKFKFSVEILPFVNPHTKKVEKAEKKVARESKKNNRRRRPVILEDLDESDMDENDEAVAVDEEDGQETGDEEEAQDAGVGGRGDGEVGVKAEPDIGEEEVAEPQDDDQLAHEQQQQEDPDDGGNEDVDMVDIDEITRLRAMRAVIGDIVEAKEYNVNSVPGNLYMMIAFAHSLAPVEHQEELAQIDEELVVEQGEARPAEVDTTPVVPADRVDLSQQLGDMQLPGAVELDDNESLAVDDGASLNTIAALQQSAPQEMVLVTPNEVTVDVREHVVHDPIVVGQEGEVAPPIRLVRLTSLQDVIPYQPPMKKRRLMEHLPGRQSWSVFNVPCNDPENPTRDVIIECLTMFSLLNFNPFDVSPLAAFPIGFDVKPTKYVVTFDIGVTSSLNRDIETLVSDSEYFQRARQGNIAKNRLDPVDHVLLGRAPTRATSSITALNLLVASQLEKAGRRTKLSPTQLFALKENSTTFEQVNLRSLCGPGYKSYTAEAVKKLNSKARHSLEDQSKLFIDKKFWRRDRPTQ